MTIVYSIQLCCWYYTSACGGPKVVAVVLFYWPWLYLIIPGISTDSNFLPSSVPWLSWPMHYLYNMSMPDIICNTPAKRSLLWGLQPGYPTRKFHISMRDHSLDSAPWLSICQTCCGIEVSLKHYFHFSQILLWLWCLHANSNHWTPLKIHTC